jgi:biotin carboxylase
MGSMPTVVIVASCESYRTGDFIRAARSQRLDVVIATDAESPFDDQADRSILVDLDDPAAAGAAIAIGVPDANAVVAVDDQGVVAAAQASLKLGLPTNPLAAIDATRDKLAMRRLLHESGVPQPQFEAVGYEVHEDSASSIPYPKVIKPVDMSASRGVIRVNSHGEFVAAEKRIRDILRSAGRDETAVLIAEEYIDGDELVVEGIVVHGELEVLAVIDKPEPLTGPFFEETIFTTPSRQTDQVQRNSVDMVRRGISALAIKTGPIHAELRIDGEGKVWIIEIAARSIGGLCGRSLSFGLLNESLESVVLRSAIGREAAPGAQSRPASGVMMLPIPAAGVLTAVEGVDETKAIRGVDGVEITVPIGREVTPLPEGDRYLGFIFASGPSPEEVDTTLQLAAATLDITIDGESIWREPTPRIE